MRRARALAFAVIALLPTARSALSLTLPYKTPDPPPKHQVQEKLVGFASLVVDAKGKAAVNVAFTNERAFDGEKHVALLLRLLNAAGNPVYVAPLQAILDDPMFKARSQKRSTQNFSLPVKAWADVAKVDFFFFPYSTEEEFKAILEGKMK